MSARTQTNNVHQDQVSQIQAFGPWHAGHDTLAPTPALQQAWRMIQKWDHAGAADVFRWRNWKLNRFNPSPCIVSLDGMAGELDSESQNPRSTQPGKPDRAPWKLEA